MSLSQHHPKHPSHPATPGNINVSQCYPCPVVSQHTHAVMFRLLLFYTESCWIFLRDEIALPENWKSEFRYSEIASFVLDDLSISFGILVKTLPHLQCVAVFTNVATEIMIRYTQKRIYKVISISPDSWCKTNYSTHKNCILLYSFLSLLIISLDHNVVSESYRSQFYL